MDRKFGETRVLTLDLSKGKTSAACYPKLVERFIGGRAANQAILMDRGVGRDDAGIPQRIAIGPGCLVGTTAPSATRSTIDSGNMYNLGIGSGSIGGRIGQYMRFSGFDHLIIEGRAKDPQYALLTQEGLELLDASSLWGMTIEETDEALRTKHGDDAAILYIGPAGENLVRMASISTDKYRTQGRCGLGMILGVMRLKALVIPRAEGVVALKQPEEFQAVVAKMYEKIRSQQALVDGLSAGGLAATMDGWLGLLNPVRNFQDGYLNEERQKALSGAAYARHATSSAGTSDGCPIRCDVMFEIQEGPYSGTKWAGVEGDVQWDFAAKLGVEDTAATVKLHALCTNLGLDVDSTSGAIAWAFESFQRGVLSKQDTDGLALEWGNVDVVVELIQRIATRKGIGDLLADGSKRASEKVGKGSDAWAIHMKGQDLAEPLRAEKGWALGCVVSPRGGGHTRGAPLPFCTPPLPDVYDPTAYEGQPERVVQTERLHSAQDCLGVCNIPSQWVNAAWPGLEDYSKLFSAAIGKPVAMDAFIEMAESAVALERMYNQLYAQFNRDDDYPPARLMEEEIKSGPMQGQRLSREDWDLMLDEYYRLHGWDEKTGLMPDADVSRLAKGIEESITPSGDGA